MARGYRERKPPTRTPRPTILIVCEGEKTEPNYLRSFRVTPNIIDVRGIGANTVSLVERAIFITSEEGPFDQTWCVFDRDNFPAAHFNEALRLANANDIQVAYSNEAFELWYLLHFDYHVAAISRNSYITKLRRLLENGYEKNSTEIYEQLYERQSKAVRHAKRLLKSYPTPNPERDNPSTTVHRLVEELNKHIR